MDLHHHLLLGCRNRDCCKRAFGSIVVVVSGNAGFSCGGNDVPRDPTVSQTRRPPVYIDIVYIKIYEDMSIYIVYIKIYQDMSIYITLL